jgi:hypothetical protein
MFDWLWKRLGGGGGSSSSSEEAAPGAAAGAALSVGSTMGSTTSAAAADANNDTSISVIADQDNASDDAKMGDATKALAGGSATKEEGVVAAANKKNKEVTAIKAKPTVAKNKSVTAGSTLTAVRTGNTRPVVPKKKLSKKTGVTTTTTTSTGNDSTPSFPEMLERLANYKAKHGNCRVPLKYAADPALAAFVKKMRRQYKAVIKVSSSGAETDPVSDESSTTTSMSSSLTIDQIRQLDQLDFVWEGKRGRPSHPK